jgi:hypothetical protein
MSLPDELRKTVEETLQVFCERRVPKRVRDQVRLSFSIRGNSALLVEERPRWDEPSEWLSLKIAQFRFDPTSLKWSLYRRDRNERWHFYSLVKPTKDFRVLLAEVDRDPTGIFWG